jgi:hypothetical protein
MDLNEMVMNGRFVVDPLKEIQRSMREIYDNGNENYLSNLKEMLIREGIFNRDKFNALKLLFEVSNGKFYEDDEKFSFNFSCKENVTETPYLTRDVFEDCIKHVRDKIGCAIECKDIRDHKFNKDAALVFNKTKTNVGDWTDFAILKDGKCLVFGVGVDNLDNHGLTMIGDKNFLSRSKDYILKLGVDGILQNEFYKIGDTFAADIGGPGYRIVYDNLTKKISFI